MAKRPASSSSSYAEEAARPAAQASSSPPSTTRAGVNRLLQLPPEVGSRCLTFLHYSERLVLSQCGKAVRSAVLQQISSLVFSRPSLASLKSLDSGFRELIVFPRLLDMMELRTSELSSFSKQLCALGIVLQGTHKGLLVDVPTLSLPQLKVMEISVHRGAHRLNSELVPRCVQLVNSIRCPQLKDLELLSLPTGVQWSEICPTLHRHPTIEVLSIKLTPTDFLSLVRHFRANPSFLPKLRDFVCKVSGRPAVAQVMDALTEPQPSRLLKLRRMVDVSYCRAAHNRPFTRTDHVKYWLRTTETHVKEAAALLRVFGPCDQAAPLVTMMDIFCMPKPSRSLPGVVLLDAMDSCISKCHATQDLSGVLARVSGFVAALLQTLDEEPALVLERLPYMFTPARHDGRVRRAICEAVTDEMVRQGVINALVGLLHRGRDEYEADIIKPALASLRALPYNRLEADLHVTLPRLHLLRLVDVASVYHAPQDMRRLRNLQVLSHVFNNLDVPTRRVVLEMRPHRLLSVMLACMSMGYVRAWTGFNNVSPPPSTSLLSAVHAADADFFEEAVSLLLGDYTAVMAREEPRPVLLSRLVIMATAVPGLLDHWLSDDEKCDRLLSGLLTGMDVCACPLSTLQQVGLAVRKLLCMSGEGGERAKARLLAACPRHVLALLLSALPVYYDDVNGAWVALVERLFDNSLVELMDALSKCVAPGGERGTGASADQVQGQQPATATPLQDIITRTLVMFTRKVERVDLISDALFNTEAGCNVLQRMVRCALNFDRRYQVYAVLNALQKLCKTRERCAQLREAHGAEIVKIGVGLAGRDDPGYRAHSACTLYFLKHMFLDVHAEEALETLLDELSSEFPSGVAWVESELGLGNDMSRCNAEDCAACGDEAFHCVHEVEDDSNDDTDEDDDDEDFELEDDDDDDEGEEDEEIDEQHDGDAWEEEEEDDEGGGDENPLCHAQLSALLDDAKKDRVKRSLDTEVRRDDVTADELELWIV